MVSPIYDKLSEGYKDFKFCKIDVDQNPQTAMKYQIVSIPMQMFFNNGEKVDEILGAVPEHMIRSKVEEILARFPSDERGKLKVILNSWIDQNKRHTEKFRKWMGKIENSEHYRHVLQTVEELEALSDHLYKAALGL
jgi:thioredoxin-like negative regulator of GroEL